MIISKRQWREEYVYQIREREPGWWKPVWVIIRKMAP